MKRTPGDMPYTHIVYQVRQYIRPPYERRWETGETVIHGTFVNANDARECKRSIVVDSNQPPARIDKLWMLNDATIAYRDILSR
jgi:hypothetical protein